MIGSGIFLLPASLAAFGGIGMIGWLCSSVGAILLAYMFGALGRYGESTIGGPYIYTRMGLGDFPAYLVAWGYWICIWTTNAAIAVALVGYLTVFIPVLAKSTLVSTLAGLGVIWLFTWINSRPLKTVATVQVITAILKVIPMFAIGMFGIAYIQWDHFVPLNLSGETNWAAITATTTLTTFAFSGMESSSNISGETKDAVRTVRRATLTGTFVTIIVYVSSSIAIMGIIPPAELIHSGAPFADAANAFWGPAAKYIVAGCAVVATMGALNGWILMQGKIPMAAAQDHLFPKIFAKVNKHNSPIAGVVISSSMASAIMILNFAKNMIDAFNFIILLSTLAVLIAYLFSAASLAIIEFRNDNTRISKNAWVALLSLIFCIWVIAGCGEETVFYGFLLLIISIPFYIFLKRSHPS